jgi:hypothetical protein
VQIIINEKLNQLSGNAQRTIFIIVKHLLIQVIRTQENLQIMRKLLHNFKRKIQESYFYYFHYIGSQKLCERHLKTITKWQEMLEESANNNIHHHNLHKSVKIKRLAPTSQTMLNVNSRPMVNLDNISFDCKLEIMRRLNNGLDLVNLSQCSKNFNLIINRELSIWKSLCQFHYQQQHINQFVTKISKKKDDVNCAIVDENNNSNTVESGSSDLDWKSIYFRLKKRFGNREIYVDMVHKCSHCKCLFWKVNTFSDI